jgi:serine/threonine protein kinase
VSPSCPSLPLCLSLSLSLSTLTILSCRYASKTLLLQHKSDEKGFFHEVKYLRQHRHPFIIHLHDVFMSSHPRSLLPPLVISCPPHSLSLSVSLCPLCSHRKVFLIMHYCEGGDLGKVISMAAKNNQPLNETQILKWISQVSRTDSLTFPSLSD